MRPQNIIEKKRDGKALSDAEIASFIDGVCTGAWEDYQITALVMAMFINGLTTSEQNVITREMLHSGKVMDFSDIDAPKADKHSTGGVGDKTSLIIAPLAASCGIAVPMISGRGLGHTGGTLDKLESIKGYNVNLSTEQFRHVVKSCGFAMTGQTESIAPADKKIYALRDATATVPYIPLIVASIMSKKLAEGLDALIVDVKTGLGAFMSRFEDSVKLAEALVMTGKEFGVRTEAVITSMDQPLGQFVGNSHEVYECVKILRNEISEAARETLDLSMDLTSRMLVLTGLADDASEARNILRAKHESGEALERFRANIALQGGDPSVCDDPEKLIERDLIVLDLRAESGGYVSAIDALKVGEVVVSLGGGRLKASDDIDPCVGYECVAKIGDSVNEGDILGRVSCRSRDQAEQAEAALRQAYSISSSRAESPALIRDSVG